MYSYAFTNKQKVVLFKLLNCNNLIAGTEWKQNIFQTEKKEQINMCVHTYTHTLHCIYVFGAHTLEYV